MPKAPPLLPHETFVRVVRLGRLDGMAVLMLAAVFAILSASAGDFTGAIFGLLVAGAGAIELHGVGMLQQGIIRGMNWLVGSQLFLLLAILSYCGVQIASIEAPPLPEFANPMIDASAQQLGMSRLEYLEFVQRLVFIVFGAVSLLYQGGMALYYHRRREPVTRALSGE